MAKREGAKRDGGGAGGLGWLLLGVIFGVAGTLAAEVFLHGSDADEPDAPRHAVAIAPPTPQPPAPVAPTRPVKTKPSAAPLSAEPTELGPRDAQAANQVADDAAAAGMTSRATN